MKRTIWPVFHRRVIVAVVLASFILGTPVIAGAGTLGPWEPNPAFDVASGMDQTRTMAVAVAPEGATTVLWGNPAGALMARTRAADAATFAVEEQLGGVLLASAGGPGNRTAVVTSVTSGATTSMVLHTREAGGGFSAPAVVGSVTGGDWIANVDVALGPSGSIVVAWALHAG
ncbi:MAG: hypothetical protein ACR2J9_00735, partial [Gaiellales bacterium]